MKVVVGYQIANLINDVSIADPSSHLDGGVQVPFCPTISASITVQGFYCFHRGFISLFRLAFTYSQHLLIFFNFIQGYSALLDPNSTPCTPQSDSNHRTSQPNLAITMSNQTRVTLLTGCSRGIGLAIAHFLLKRNPIDKVFAIARSAGPLEELQNQYPGQVEYITADLADLAVCTVLTSNILRIAGRRGNWEARNIGARVNMICTGRRLSSPSMS